MPTTFGAPHNLMPDPSLEGVASTNWTAAFGGVLETSAVARSGVQSIVEKRTAAFPATDRLGPTMKANVAACAPGDVISASAYVRRLPGEAFTTTALWLYFLNASGGAIGGGVNKVGPTVNPSTAGWTLAVVENAVAPAGTVSVSVTAMSEAVPTNGYSAVVDDIAIVKQATAVAYDDTDSVAPTVRVTTEDATPTAAPNRISRDPAKDDVAAAFTPTHDGQLVPSADLLPGGTAFPDEVWPDDDTYPDQGAPIPGMVRDIIGWELRVGGVGPSAGKLIARRGNRCSPTRLCGTRAAIDPNVAQHGWRSPSGQEITAAFTFADVDDGGADGVRDVSVYALTEGQGWS